MKQKILNTLLAFVALGALAANTNNATVSILLSDQQQEELKFLKRYYGSTNNLKNFATNIVVSVVWDGPSQAALQQRRDRVWSLMVANTNDVNWSAAETAFGLPGLTNSVILYP